MNQHKNRATLDELVSNTIAGEILEFDFKEWKQQHPQDIHEFTAGTRNRKVPINIGRRITRNRITKLTAAVIMIGIFGGAAYLLVPGTGNSEQIREGAEQTDRNALNMGGYRAVKRIDREKINAEARIVEEMVAAGDVDGLVKMLSDGTYESKVLAAEYLGEIGDETALPKLKVLNKQHGSWLFGKLCVFVFYEDSRTSGAFAAAMCKIMTRDLSQEEQVEAWFDLLQGRGPIMPVVDKLYYLSGSGPALKAKDGDMTKEYPNLKFTSGFDVGRRVGANLIEFDDPSILARLRQTENKGAAVSAVWMEVRNMETEQAIERCMEIARTEEGAQQYGAIKCLGELGEPAIYALDDLALEGYVEAIGTFDYFGNSPEVLDILCWHLTNNKNPQVRLKVILPKMLSPAHTWRFRQPALMQALVTALYDPNDRVRYRAAGLLRNAAGHEETQLLDHEEDLLIALKHPDEEIRPYIAQALDRLGSKRLNEEVPDPPEIRTDLEKESESPMLLER